jgi:hypothetical protein
MTANVWLEKARDWLRPLPEPSSEHTRRAVIMVVREARLRPEWAGLYPGLEAGVWMVAAQLVPLVLRHRLQGQPTWEFTRRILVDEHFEFRGGRDRDSSWTGVLSRVEDA